MSERLWVVVPASGIGSRMQANKPKQYLRINQQPIAQLTLNVLSKIDCQGIIVAVNPKDDYWATIDTPEQVIRCDGGEERVDSVYNALHTISQKTESDDWVLVHDIARPCVHLEEIEKLIQHCKLHNRGALLAAKVTDTLKHRSQHKLTTVDRNQFYQALTPQMFRLRQLISSLQQAKQQNLPITDEASAVELTGAPIDLVLSRRDNIKITQPEDLALAAFYLKQ